MRNVDITVIIRYADREFSATDETVRLNDDDVQASAANLAYGLVEDVWGAVEDEEIAQIVRERKDSKSVPLSEVAERFGVELDD